MQAVAVIVPIAIKCIIKNVIIFKVTRDFSVGYLPKIKVTLENTLAFAMNINC